MADSAISEEQANPSFVEHKKAEGFTSFYANGFVVAGPGPSGLYSIFCYEDAPDLLKEHLNLKDDGEYETKFEVGDIVGVKEDKARISLDEEAMKALFGLLKERVGKQPEE